MALNRSWSLSIVAVVHLLQSCSRTLDSPKARLDTELQRERWFEARLSGASVHRPCEPVCNEKRVLCAKSCGVLPEQAASIAESLPAGPLAESLKSEEAYPLSLLQFLRGSSEREDDRAVQTLEQRAAEFPANARLLNDLAAVYLVRAERRDRPSDLARALEVAERAVRADPTLLEARFNVALARDALFLGRAAVEAWQTYQAVDPDSDWAREAQSHIDRLASLLSQDSDAAARWDRDRKRIEADISAERVPQLIEIHRTASREWVENDLMPGWAQAWARGDSTEAERLLGTARVVATVLSQPPKQDDPAGSDPFLLEAVEVIERALRDAVPSRLRLLVQGHQAFADDQRRHPPANWRQAIDSLKAAGSPVWLKAQIELAVAVYLDNEPGRALSLLDEVRAKAISYKSLDARAAWIAALCQQRKAQPLLVLREYRRARELYREIGERENVANVDIRMAEELEHVGDRELAWRRRYSALEGVQFLRERTRRHFVFGEAASASLHQGLDHVALLLQDRAVADARQTDQPDDVAIALPVRAAIHLKLGDASQAEKDLAEALEFASRISDLATLQQIQARIEEVRGLLLLREDPLAAADAFGAAIDLRTETQGLDFLPPLYAQRARAYLAGGLAEEAKADLQASAARIEEEWTRMLGDDARRQEDFWTPYFDEEQEVFGRLIDLLVSTGEHRRAFELAEQSRAREPLDSFVRSSLSRDRRKALSRSLGPQTLEEVQEGLPAGTVLIQYRVLEDRLLTWVVGLRSFLHLESKASIHDIEGWIQSVYDHFRGLVPEREMYVALEKLHEALVPSEHLPAVHSLKLVFVPDGPVHGVPFSALRSPVTKRFLIQDHTVAVSPSATLYLLSLDRSRQLMGRPADSLLVVADPAFDREQFPHLPDLPGAVMEAELIRAYYSSPPPLTGFGATKRELLRLLGTQSVVHFSGHAVSNGAKPSQSFLLLAPSNEDDGVLYAFELLNHDFGKTRLMVLSACSTSGGYLIGSIGVSGLVRPFLGGGVPAVVASLWDVRDSTTPPLLIAFHRRFQEGKEASAALREAQLELLTGKNRALKSVESWAAFQVIGEAYPN